MSKTNKNAALELAQHKIADMLLQNNGAMTKDSLLNRADVIIDLVADAFLNPSGKITSGRPGPSLERFWQECFTAAIRRGDSTDLAYEVANTAVDLFKVKFRV